MYTFTSKLKSIAIICMVVGLLGVAYSFITAPTTVEQVKELVAHHHGDVAHSQEHSQAHYEHILHQMQNKPWAAFYLSALYFMLISLGVLAFYAINRAAQAGWSPVLFRVMEGITGYLPVGGVIFFVLLLASSFHLNHLFVWMDADVVAKDTLLQGKQGFLNVPFFLIRAVVFIGGWVAYRAISRKLSIAEDNDDHHHTAFVKNFKWAAGFLVFFLVSESMMSWDWIMSLDPHWFSTLFGWYVFGSLITAAVSTIILVSVYLKSKGHLEHMNDSHLHDLAKFMFGFSIFWTYLWFSQFLLYWYSNIPEEIVYFKFRIDHYLPIILSMLLINFVLPLIILVDSDIKRKPMVVGTMAFIIIIGHYLDFFNMLMPATVGESWSLGIGEIGSFVFFLGLFIFVVFTSLTKAPLLAKGNAFIEESKHHHY